ncbi:outer membrane beta-barrel domain-containing protein [Alcanivorax sp. S6407]|uniref:outer membrane beta-barrel domain-containing protein n=1 Tax=Alcanivorax sp. S6407 TaxID=2926424 RepID=UPI001FF623FB|nr:outer membrane beta-barrel domain-containing protein [Alcanivorax sp. S6407]MCK0153416.1 outer membrane beta-barrel domain-containing protein [Alcanivorax sp. S6407]
MENRLLCIVLSLLLPLLANGEEQAEQEDVVRDARPESVLDPQIERRQITEADIDTENFEAGVYVGMISIEDFGTQPVLGLRLNYHLSEDIFFEGVLGRAKADETSFERLNDGVELLTDDERAFTYYQGAVGYNLLPGEAFLNRNRAFNNALYVLGGAGITEFAGDEHFTISLGVGYRLLINDFTTVRVDMKDHLFNLDVLGEDKMTQNMEFSAGVSLFF